MRKLILIASLALMAVPVARGQTYVYVQAQPVQDGPAAFLALLNADRARLRLAPVGWDQNLAAFAATNSGIHAPGSSGGASQCWAGMRSYTQAYYAWRASPAHWAILTGARSAVGVAICPSGITANCR